MCISLECSNRAEETSGHSVKSLLDLRHDVCTHRAELTSLGISIFKDRQVRGPSMLLSRKRSASNCKKTITSPGILQQNLTAILTAPGSAIPELMPSKCRVIDIVLSMICSSNLIKICARSSAQIAADPWPKYVKLLKEAKVQGAPLKSVLLHHALHAATISENDD